MHLTTKHDLDRIRDHTGIETPLAADGQALVMLVIPVDDLTRLADWVERKGNRQ